MQDLESDDSGFDTPPLHGERGEFAPLADPDDFNKDNRLVRRAIREGWPIGQAQRGIIVNRLMEIVQKRTVDVPTKEGMVASEAVADVNANAASKTLAGLHWANLTEQGKTAGVGGGASLTVIIQAATPPTKVVINEASP